MARLTDRGVAAIKPTDERQQIADDNCKGLSLIVHRTGRKTWSIRYRVGAVHRRFTLGEYPVMGLAEARDRAREAMADAQAGLDPQGEKERAKADTVAAVVDEFNRFHLSKLKSGKNALGFLNRSIVKEWGHRPVVDITKRDVSRLLLNIVASGREVTANRTFAHVRKFFNWCAEHGYLENAPTDRMKMPTKEESRDRFLTDGEIALFWAATEKMASPYRQALRLLLLTGQRHGEVVGLTSDEVTGDLWHLPSARTKNGIAHDVPLTEAALAELASLPRIGDSLLITTNGTSPITNLNAKADECLALMVDLAGCEIERWRPHDLRRTLETGLARLGIAESLTDRITNHMSSQPKIRRVYNRHDYAQEKREALTIWAAHITAITNPR
ncbi:tyrosine-type recombinase/integrase [Pontibaca salina]|uniref:Integrase arm-type DNA-binding domain-containing protein n=1 Tax=Pontibaca salina TaxID=2795731 RepID=A0A934HNW1_9RHOB|nr:site-specific integrase [Pontibaca salina]MBI6628281.1 integrase arm-type DNA-binding domain-containing protein [Pontibaca salina]